MQRSGLQRTALRACRQHHKFVVVAVAVVAAAGVVVDDADDAGDEDDDEEEEEDDDDWHRMHTIIGIFVRKAVISASMISVIAIVTPLVAI